MNVVTIVMVLLGLGLFVVGMLLATLDRED